ncbi:VirD4-like conjugal transfer protein, CD1115 family [Priestia sp. FSL R5-0680]|uniref:VirD4-like conjugal transfer protein, CD1115 family n=1 Tax=Priestia sp. FSL R5-0680 TaxID=2921582 RepID=UPI0030F6321F
MNKSVDKGTLFMSVLISAVVVVIVDLLLLSFVTNFPTNHDMKDVTAGMKQPLELYEAAKGGDLFLPLQLICIAGAIFLAFKFYKLILGDGKYKDASSYGSEGTTRFSKETEVFNDKDFVKKTFNKSSVKNLENPEGLIFGLLNNKPVIVPENTKIPNRNVFIIGSPGAGKSQAYLLTNLLAEKTRSMVITDPKGEIYEASAKFKQEQGYEVRLINFKEMLVSDKYNPLDYIEKEIDAEQVSNTIVINSLQGQKPDFWTKAEIALLKTLLLYVKYECPTEANLATVKRILTTHGSTPEEMDDFFKRLEPDHPAFSAYQIVRMANDKVRDSIFVSLAITLSKFDATDVRKFTETSDFQLDDIGRKKMIVYVILPVADNTWEPLIANFFTQMFQRLYDVADKNFNKLPVSVNLLLDEFPNLGTIPGYEERLATCRSYGISVSTIIQSMGQLIDKYNKEKAEAIVGNCSLRFLLSVGDKLTAEYFSDLIGKTTISKHSKSVSKNEKGGSDSKSDSYSGRHLLMADELTRLPRDEAILLVTGGLPIKLKKAFQFEFFKGILNENNKSSRFDYLKDVAGAKDKTSEEVSNTSEEVLERPEPALENIEVPEKKTFTLEDLIEDDHSEEKHVEKTKINIEKSQTQESEKVKKENGIPVQSLVAAGVLETGNMLSEFDKNNNLDDELAFEPEVEQQGDELMLEPEVEQQGDELMLEPEVEQQGDELMLEPEVEQQGDELMLEPEVEQQGDELMLEPEVEQQGDELMLEPEVEQQGDELMLEPEVEQQGDELMLEPTLDASDDDLVLEPTLDASDDDLVLEPMLDASDDDLVLEPTLDASDDDLLLEPEDENSELKEPKVQPRKRERDDYSLSLD